MDVVLTMCHRLKDRTARAAHFRTATRHSLVAVRMESVSLRATSSKAARNPATKPNLDVVLTRKHRQVVRTILVVAIQPCSAVVRMASKRRLVKILTAVRMKQHLFHRGLKRPESTNRRPHLSLVNLLMRTAIIRRMGVVQTDEDPRQVRTLMVAMSSLRTTVQRRTLVAVLMDTWLLLDQTIRDVVHYVKIRPMAVARTARPRLMDSTKKAAVLLLLTVGKLKYSLQLYTVNYFWKYIIHLL